MVAITLPDGSVKRFDGPVTGAEHRGLDRPGPGQGGARAARRRQAASISATMVDHDAKIAIVTSQATPTALELLRHDAAHVLAEAVQELYPGTQITFGPATEDGFYYDFARDEPFTPEDFAKIEAAHARDRRPRRADHARGLGRATRIECTTSTKHGEQFKAEWARRAARGRGDLDLRQGDWLDLCLGPHLPSTGKLGKAFKLMKVSGAYWRGDCQQRRSCSASTAPPGATTRSSRPICIAWRRPRSATTAGSAARWACSISRKRRSACVFWHPKGWTLWRTLEGYLRRRLEAGGYVEVKTPQLVDRTLWEASGHWEKFRENMFSATPRLDARHRRSRASACSR